MSSSSSSSRSSRSSSSSVSYPGGSPCIVGPQGEGAGGGRPPTAERIEEAERATKRKEEKRSRLSAWQGVYQMCGVRAPRDAGAQQIAAAPCCSTEQQSRPTEATYRTKHCLYNPTCKRAEIYAVVQLLQPPASCCCCCCCCCSQQLQRPLLLLLLARLLLRQQQQDPLLAFVLQQVGSPSILFKFAKQTKYTINTNK